MDNNKNFCISSSNKVITNGMSIDLNINIVLDDEMIGIMPVSAIEAELQKCFKETIKDLTYKAACI